VSNSRAVTKVTALELSADTYSKHAAINPLQLTAILGGAKMGNFVRTFQEIDRNMSQLVGGKGAHLGELTRFGVNVPGGYCVTSDSYYHHLQTNHLVEPILEIEKQINYDDFQDLENKTAKIRALIDAAVMPPEIEEEIKEHYEKLAAGNPECFVAVRSSVGVKDSNISSFPGMMDTYHYINGSKDVVSKVKDCWASVWSARGAFARHNKGIDHMMAIIAPVVQLMVNSEVAGVAFTVNPINKKDEFVIEANWGLGESVVSGKAMADMYIIERNYNIKERRVSRKEKAYVKANGGGGQWITLEPEKMNVPALTDAQIIEICKTAALIEQHYGYNQDTEWAFEKGRLYLLQARRAKVGGGT